MGFERYYRIKILSNQILHNRQFSSLTYQPTAPLLPLIDALDPWFVTGFTDAGGSFMIRIRKNSKYNTGWLVSPVFSITLHIKDLLLLESFQAYFGGIGNISKSGLNCFKFKVESLKDITNNIIPHFTQFPLQTQKGGEFLLFNTIIKLMNIKDHLKIEGVNKIVSIKASLNNGLPEDLKIAFPDIKPVARPLVQIKECCVPHVQWISGFTSGDGCFKVSIYKKPTIKIGYRVVLVFQITQHSRDEHLLNCLLKYFACGIIEKDPKGPYLNYSVYRFSDNYDKIMPFFIQNKLVRIKSKDFKDWCKIAEIIKSGDHLTSVGLENIFKIRSGMNTGRG